ncbi:uncharacterized protein LOC135495575 [Lineus longissimus]|uniref:uncharacterized protein LOC135495575 n=1 Tax=Lineus longissimus TaxID=88925 RepID=UPI002B4F0E91
MKMSMIVLLLVGVSATFAMPTSTASPKPSMKDAVRMLLESSELLQNWGNTVLDASKTGLNAANVQNLMSSGANARQRFQESIEKASEMMKKNGQEGAPASIYKDMAEGAVEMLKEEARLEVFTEDDKLALIAGDKLAADTMRLRINMHLFTRSMEVLDGTVSELESLLADDVTDSDIVQVLPELVEEIGSEGTALSIVFKAIEESFEDATYMLEPLIEEETKEGEKEEEKQDTPSRQRRSPRGSLGRSTFGSRGGSFGSRRGSFGRSSSRGIGRSGSRSGSGFSRDLGRGWSVGTGGLSWSNRRGNVHFNAKPTFGGGGVGAHAGIRIDF